MNVQQYFQDSQDVVFQQIDGVLLGYCEAMVDMQLLYEVVMPAVLKQEAVAPPLVAATLEDLPSAVYRGEALLYIKENETLFTVNVAKKPNRSPEESSAEVTVRGPRDDFIEDLAVNVALIRKRLPTRSLAVERLVVGQRSETAIAILYFVDIADLAILEEMKAQIAKIQGDIIFSADLLMEDVNKRAVLFPRMDYTGRPDFAVQALVRGRFIVVVDGVSYVVITPVNLSLLLKTGEDNEYPVLFSAFERLLRVTSLAVGTLLPAFWLALTSFHPNQLPFQLLATVVQSNIGLPLPSVLETLLMLFMFELLREAGFRLPTAIGSTLGVVGGIIIGDAAIRAGLTSPAMIVIIATATIATYTLVNQSLSTAVSLLRIAFVLCAGLFGLFGFFLSLYVLLVYLASIRIFGVPYINIAADLSWKTLGKSLTRLKQQNYAERPSMMKPQDDTRSKS